MAGELDAVTSFLLTVVSVHLNETEDQVNDTDDQTADLNKLRKRDHGHSPLSIKSGGTQEVPPKKNMGRTHRVLLVGGTLTDRITQKET